MLIQEQYGTTRESPLRCAITGGTTLRASSGGSRLIAPDFITNTSVGNTVKIKDQSALAVVQVINDARTLTVSPALLNTPIITGGTVNMLNNSTMVQGTNTSFNRLRAGDLLLISNSPLPDIWCEIDSIVSDQLLYLTAVWTGTTNITRNFQAFPTTDFHINRSRTPGLGFHLFHDGSLDYTALENDNWRKAEQHILAKTGLYTPIQANEAIAVDDCLHALGITGSGHIVVERAVCTVSTKLPCCGFATSNLSVNAQGHMAVGNWITTVGMTNYPFTTLVVGRNSKIAWLGSSNYPVANEFQNIIGEGRGNGTIQFMPNPVLIQL